MRMKAVTGLVIGLLAARAISLGAQSPSATKRTIGATISDTLSAGVVNKSNGSSSITRSWVDTSSTLPNLSGAANDVAIEHIHIEPIGLDTSQQGGSSVAGTTDPGGTFYRGPAGLAPLTKDTTSRRSRQP
jgi:hypothetical protein